MLLEDLLVLFAELLLSLAVSQCVQRDSANKLTSGMICVNAVGS